MSIHSQKFARSEQFVSDLPIVPAAVLDRIFKHLNADEQAIALRHRLVPIAWLPHATLYADASVPGNGDYQSNKRHHVVARINSQDFDAAVRRHWRKRLAYNAAMGLARKTPSLSARNGVPGTFGLLSVAALFALPFAFLPFTVVANVFGLLSSSFFLGVIWLRLVAITEPTGRERDIPEMNDEKLPHYSVLVPLFREVGMLPQIIHALKSINYPLQKLDIKLVLEDTDTYMKQALARFSLPPHFEVLIVPPGSPQTKPRALNYALQFARGSLLTIYDAEDIPQPMQLRMAARRFAAEPADLACLQAELAFYNSNENWLTRQFTIEYAVLFKLILPSLARVNWPIPLGGTSNHFRASALHSAGGWDAYNVTEDADLGTRLCRLGYTVGTLGSHTYEEASSTPKNWLKQRARWMKGFLITWLVHMRHPIQLVRELGVPGFLVLQANLLGVIASALFYPLFIVWSVWKLACGGFTQEGVQGALDCYFMTLIPITWLVMMLSGTKALREKGIRGWGITIATMPIYWLCSSVAGYLAVWEFLWAPFYWNKTQHGVSRVMNAPRQAVKAAPISRP